MNSTKHREDWKKHVLNVDAPHDVDTATETVDLLFETFYQVGASGIDLRGLEPSLVNPFHLATVLRWMLPIRDLVIGWDEALLVARLSLVTQGLDENDALRGLI